MHEPSRSLLTKMPQENEPQTFKDAFGLSYIQLARLWIGWGPMKDISIQLWTNPAYFTGVCRFVIVSVMGAVLTGKIILPDPIEGWVYMLAPFIAALGVGIPAGQTNQTPGEIKQIAHDPEVIEAAPPTK
jgi:hypothetical protein